MTDLTISSVSQLPISNLIQSLLLIIILFSFMRWRKNFNLDSLKRAILIAIVLIPPFLLLATSYRNSRILFLSTGYLNILFYMKGPFPFPLMFSFISFFILLISPFLAGFWIGNIKKGAQIGFMISLLHIFMLSLDSLIVLPFAHGGDFGPEIDLLALMLIIIPLFIVILSLAGMIGGLVACSSIEQRLRVVTDL
ncbi:MAG: hypothetical protein ACFFB2_20870 [Promethearchaeota archaeon]